MQKLKAMLILSFIAYVQPTYAYNPATMDLTITNYGCTKDRDSRFAPLYVYADLYMGDNGCRVIDPTDGQPKKRILINAALDSTQKIQVYFLGEKGYGCDYRVEIEGGTNAPLVHPLDQVNCVAMDTIPFCVCNQG